MGEEKTEDFDDIEIMQRNAAARSHVFLWKWLTYVNYFCVLVGLESAAPDRHFQRIE